MLKKLVLSSLIVLGIMYGAGYDFHWIKHDMLELASNNAAEMTGNGDRGGWGD